MSDPIKPILRSLNVLRSLNRRQMSTLRELQQDTALPKSTVHRLLATLVYGGYVQRDEELGVYSLTSKVRSLADGFHDNSRFVEAAAPLAERITREVKWPVAVGTFDVDAMVVRYSTRRHSSLTLQNTTVNQRFPLLESAMGQAYLAFCSTAQRRQIVAALKARQSDRKAMIHNAYQFRSFLEKIRERGHGLRVGERGESTHIAIPVICRQNIEGVIGISLFSSCYNDKTRVEYLRVLRTAAKQMVVAMKD